MRDGRVVKIVNPKLRKFRNNLRNIWLYFNLRQDNKIRINQEMQDRYGKSPIIKTIALTHYSTKEIKRMANYSICLCPICLNNDQNMVWHQRSETWYCESCYDQLVADKISDDLRKKVEERAKRKQREKRESLIGGGTSPK